MSKLTPQQEAFIKTASGSGSVALRARAGTGKTFSLRQWADATRKGGLATSFSKSTVGELSKKMPVRFSAKTLHALGRSAIKSAGKLGELSSSKMFDIVKDIAKEQDIPFETAGAIRSLAVLAKTYGIQPDPKGPAGLTSTDEASWSALADLHDIEFTDEVFHYAQEAVIASNEAFLKAGVIDFDDMLYIPLLYKYRFPRYPIILADEVQDFNTLQHTILRRSLLPGGRVIAAGDDRQAIYAFRGALSNSYTSLVKSFKMTELPLTVSFRCPRAVVRAAQAYVPDIEAAPGCIEGSVLYPTSVAVEDLPPAILCRNNAPLIRLALHLLVEGHTVEVAGRDIGQGLVTLTKRITKKNLSSAEFSERLIKWREREIERYPRRKARINDKYSALVALAQSQPDLKSIQSHLLSLYPDKKSKDYYPAQFQLSTIHRAKGLEWPRVLFLDPQLLPSRYATQHWELVQEANLSYVAVTRAQEELVFAPSTAIEGLSDE